MIESHSGTLHEINEFIKCIGLKKENIINIIYLGFDGGVCNYELFFWR